MANTRDLGFLDYWHIVVRRKWIIISTVAAAMLVAWGLCVILPKSYRSNTTVLVESQKIPESFVQSVVGGSIEERLSSIKQVVMSRTLLSQIATEFRLLKDEMTPQQKEEVLNDMRTVVRVDTVLSSSSGRERTIEAFTISFAHQDPVTAKAITERFASQFIEQNLKIREQLVEGASDFLEQELLLSKDKLEAQEQLISDFKSKYIGELPQQMEANLRFLDRNQLDLNASQENIQVIAGRLSIVEKEITEHKVTGRTSTSNEVGGAGRVQTDPLVARLSETERSLAALKAADYKDTYPDIVSARQEIESLKVQLAEKYGVSKELVKQGEMTVFDPVFKELVHQRDGLRIELQNAKERERHLLEQKKQIEGRVERTPAHEQDLMILLRDYENSQKNYQALLDKKLHARVAENLEKRQKGEQFRILDSANLPVSPEKPNRPMILLGGLAVGCGLGFGVAFALEMLRPAFRREEEVDSLLGIPVLAGIPSFNTLLGAKEKLAVASTPKLEKKNISRLLSYRGKSKAEFVPVAETEVEPLPSEVSWNVIAKWWPSSMIAEQYRVAVTRLALMSREQEHPVALITSSVMGEGKSTTTINLGYMFAQALDKKTLIVDCDFKRPAVGKYLGVSSMPGLSDYWMGTHTIDACLHKVDEIPLWVLPAGTDREPMFQLSKIRQLEGLLNEIRPRFDQILLDAPPVFPLADLNFLSRLADVMVFVIQAGKTNRNVVEKALKALRPQCQVGVILAGMESASIPHYQYHYDDRAAERYVVKK